MSFSISAISSSVCTNDFFFSMIYGRECFCMGVKKESCSFFFFFFFFNLLGQDTEKYTYSIFHVLLTLV